jgi:putative ABC transport system permease protein
MPFRAAIEALRNEWKAALLSMVGVAIASVAILLLVSIGLGVQKDITKQVDDLGANVLVVVPGKVDPSMGFNPNLGGQSYLEEQDAERLRKVPGVRRVALLTFAGGGVRSGENEAFPLIIAATPDWFEMHNSELAEGRFLTPEDAAQNRVVLGSVAKDRLFPDAPSALGKTVEINKRTYTIVGVLANQESSESVFSAQSFQNVAYLTYDHLKAISPDVQIDRFMVQGDPAADPKNLVPALERALDERLDDQQFSVLTQQDLLKLIYQVMGILGTLVVGLTSIALFVGGVGIMTVMLMAINERRVEIGIRRAVGAQSQDIFRQFLAEAILIGLIGSLTGLVFSSLICWGIATFTPIKPLMTLGTVALAFGVGIGVGAIFGAIPALKAGRQDPLVSLRNL